MEALDALGTRPWGAALADRVVGRAVALLADRWRLRAVYGERMSRSAREVLERAAITAVWGELVPAILNREGTGLCPIERRVLTIDDAEEALATLRAMFPRA